MTASPRAAKAYKSSLKPVWCPGCGHFAVLSAATKAFAHLELEQQDVAVVSGIGCSSRVPAYMSTYGFHGIHGRALPLATGLKAMRPELTVVVAGGDGDGFSIGGNHFLHACRRNVDLTYIVMDNEVYGMTKGQASPTTAPDWLHGKLTPQGSGTRPFNPAAIALSSGASFVARAFSGQPNEIARILCEAISHRGFSFVQVLSPCPTFVPAQKEWKQVARAFDDGPTGNAEEALRRVHADDGYSTGIIYQDDHPTWQPTLGQEVDVAAFEREFAI